MIKFRFVIVDFEDNVIEVLHETKEYSSPYDKEWLDEEYHLILEYAEKYNLADYNNPDVPIVEIHEFKNGEWKFRSDCTEDYFNL